MNFLSMCCSAAHSSSSKTKTSRHSSTQHYIYLLHAGPRSDRATAIEAFSIIEESPEPRGAMLFKAIARCLAPEPRRTTGFFSVCLTADDQGTSQGTMFLPLSNPPTASTQPLPILLAVPHSEVRDTNMRRSSLKANLLDPCS